MNGTIICQDIRRNYKYGSSNYSLGILDKLYNIDMWMYSDQLVEGLYKQYQKEIANNLALAKRSPKFDIILVGDDLPSQKYVEIKTARASELGIKTEIHHLVNSSEDRELSTLIAKINQNKDSDGLILQLPLPRHLDYRQFVDLIDPKKDLDGLSPVSLGRLIYNLPGFVSCTPKAIIALAQFYQIQFKDKKIVILGTGPTVGRPLSLLLQNLGLVNNVTVLSKEIFKNSNSIDGIRPILAEAEILISALGMPRIIKADMLRQDVIIFDVGLSQSNGITYGDIDPDSRDKAKLISPTFRGIGPITVAFLLESVIKSWKSRLIKA